MMATRARSRRLGAWMIAAGLLLAASAAQAQVQRSFVNLGFEAPNLQTAGCRVYIGDSFVPGWTTNHPAFGQQNVGGCVAPPGFVVGQAAPIIELWRTPRSGVDARSGLQLAELNAEVVSRISQNVCLESGEQVNWSFSHRGRNSDTVQDVMEFLVGSNPIVRVGTTSTGVGGVITTNQGSAGSAAGPGGWRDYSGAFVYSGTPGVTNVGFESISAAGGATAGNFLDDIALMLRPYIEFAPTAASTPEGQGATGVPALRVTGVIATAIDVLVTINGGTAVLGTDFSAPGGTFSVTIPAGDYGQGQDFPLPLSAIDNAIVQDNRTVALGIQEDPANYVIGSTSDCGAPANAEITWTIVDNDIDLLTTKSVSDETPAAGTSFEYTVTYANNTARPILAPLDAHDVTADVEDVVPAGLSFDSWICQASNGASCPGGVPDGSTTGSGAITGIATLPAGNVAAGGSLTYVITAMLDGTTACDAITNITTITTPAGVSEGTSAAPGFVTPVPGGTANNTASVDVAQACADLSIAKSAIPASVTSGDEIVYTLLIGNDGPAAADGAVLTDPPAPGLDCSTGTLSCGGETGGAVCPASPTIGDLQGAGLVIPTLPAGGSLQFTLTCTVTASGEP